MDLSGIIEYITTSKAALDLVKSANDLMPKGKKRDEIGQQIQVAEDILKRSDVKLAKDLVYHICQCTFPPQIMLWHEQQRS